MECLAIFRSGNYVYNLCRVLEREGYVFEVVSTPCQIAKEGCGYCLKFPYEYKDLVVERSRTSGIAIKEIYEIVPLFNKNKYNRIM